MSRIIEPGPLLTGQATLKRLQCDNKGKRGNIVNFDKTVGIGWDG